MVVSRRVGWFLVAFGAWSWVIWPTFLKNIWVDPRSWNSGMTAFFGVHLALTVVSLALGTAIGWIGWRIARPGLRIPDGTGASGQKVTV